MNVLDRADKPMTMLRQIRDMLHPENVSCEDDNSPTSR